jgi:hypothetical protein
MRRQAVEGHLDPHLSQRWGYSPKCICHLPRFREPLFAFGDVLRRSLIQLGEKIARCALPGGEHLNDIADRIAVKHRFDCTLAVAAVDFQEGSP